METNETKTCNILSIDAWANSCGGWDWNNWHKVGEIELDAIPQTTRKILSYMRKEGYLSEYSKGKVSIDDDQYNIVICDKNTRMPLLAIEYGNHY